MPPSQRRLCPQALRFCQLIALLLNLRDTTALPESRVKCEPYGGLPVLHASCSSFATRGVVDLVQPRRSTLVPKPLDTEHWSRREPRRRTKVTNTHTLHFITHLYTCRLDGAPACNAQVLISNYFRPCLLFEAWGLWCLESRGCLPVPHAAQEEGAFCLQRSFWRELDDNGKGAIIAGSLRRNLKPEPMH